MENTGIKRRSAHEVQPFKPTVMKTIKMNLMLVVLFTGITMLAKAQSANEWHILLNNDHSAFNMKIMNNEMTFTFTAKDTLTFFHGNKKPMKTGVNIEVSLKNNSKVIWTTSDKNLSSDKTLIMLPMADVYAAIKNVKLPSKPKFLISIKEKTTVIDKIMFEISE